MHKVALAILENIAREVSVVSNQNNLSEYAFSMHSKFRESGYMIGHLLYMHLALNEFVLHSPLGD